MFLIKRCFTNSKDRDIVVCNSEIYFSWQLKSDKQNVFQDSYELGVYDLNDILVWTSGKVNSNKSLNIPYEGKSLESRQEYYWKVKVWNNYNEFTESNPIRFEMGLNSKSDWIGKWIEADYESNVTKEEFNMGNIFKYHPNPREIENIKLDPPFIFSKKFKIKDKKIKRARIYITAHGVYEASINGVKIGDEYLSPGFTSYPKIQYYQTYDITGQIEATNKLEVIVADGWYKGKIGLAGIGNQFGDKVALLAQIEIDYYDGEKTIIGTDKSFIVETGQIEYSDLFIGERQNHNISIRKQYCIIEKNYGYNQIEADIAEPIRCIEKIKPIRVIETPKGEIVLDFGRNIAGIVEVKVEGKKGSVIQLQHAEELDKEGNFFFNIIGQNKYQTTTYILNGYGTEVFKPKFTYQGFRYVKVTGYPGEIAIDNFTAYVLSSDIRRAGMLVTSNEKINKLLENIYHSQESNFISVPTDCPQREKGGWTGDAQIYIPTAIFNMKIDNFMRRWLKNMRLDQYVNGQIPGLIPWIESDEMLSGGFGNISAAGWADACIIIPYNLYIQYEDINFLKDNYNMMKIWIKYVEDRCKVNINDKSKDYERYLWDMDFHYGDWLTPSLVNDDGSPDPMLSSKMTANQVATMYFAYSSELLSKIAEILEDEEDKIYYKQLSNNIKDAFNKAYVVDGIISGDLQGLYVLALHFNMSNEEDSKKFISRLVEKIKENGNCLDTGFLSTPLLLDVLSKNGYRELAYTVLLQEKSPSWLYQVNKGATTIWESWQAILEDGTRNITSYNHYSLGSVQDYIVREIAGLTKVSDRKGKYIVKPDFESPFEYIKLSYESPYGLLKIDWSKSNNKINIEVPVGLTIDLYLQESFKIGLGSGVYEFNIIN